MAMITASTCGSASIALVVGVGDVRPVGGGDALEQILGRVAEGVQLGVAGLAASLEVRGLGDLARAEHTDPQAALVGVSHRAPQNRDPIGA